MKKLLILAAASIILTACGSSEPAMMHSKNDAASAIMAAEHEAGRAASENYEWRDTGKLIKSAKAALKEDKYDDAVKLATKAKKQSSLALMQHDANQHAKPAF